jgi:hypothetical protein
MKSKTLEDIVNTPQLIDGVEVTGRFGEGETFIGKIVGQSSIGLVPNYIVEMEHSQMKHISTNSSLYH